MDDLRGIAPVFFRDHLMDSPLFVSDVVLPEQTEPRVPAAVQKMPEYRLAVALLEDALSTYQKCAFSSDARKRMMFDEAESWILSRDDSYEYSFERICAVLEFDPDYIREGIQRWRMRTAQERREEA